MTEILFIKADEVSEVLGVSRAEAYRIAPSVFQLFSQYHLRSPLYTSDS